MAPRILLDDERGAAPPLHRPTRPAKVRSTPRGRRPIAEPDWERPAPAALLLFVPEEPSIGLRFRYHGIAWEVVDYRHGWVARMVVH